MYRLYFADFRGIPVSPMSIFGLAQLEFSHIGTSFGVRKPKKAQVISIRICGARGIQAKAFSRLYLDMVRVRQDWYRRMVGCCVRLGTPVHAGGKIVLKIVAPAPQRYLVAGK